MLDAATTQTVLIDECLNDTLHEKRRCSQWNIVKYGMK